MTGTVRRTNFAPPTFQVQHRLRLSLDRIEAAAGELSKVFVGTPQYECESLSETLGCSVTLKVETLNPIRCFKGRGTEIALLRAIKQGARSVVCASAGNLGQAVAYCSRERRIRATVVASRWANETKLHRIASLGAKLQLVDGDIEVARDVAKRIARTEGAHLIEDSENIGTCEDAATIGLELVSVSNGGAFDEVLIALGGGAMATGVGFVLKERSPKTKVICVQPAGAPAMTLSWRARSVVQTETMDTIADGVAGRFPIPEVLEDLLVVADDALLVEESRIIQAMRLLYEHAGIIVEPSAALGVAALIEHRDKFTQKRVATIICGSNVCLHQFNQWMVGR